MFGWLRLCLWRRILPDSNQGLRTKSIRNRWFWCWLSSVLQIRQTLRQGKPVHKNSSTATTTLAELLLRAWIKFLKIVSKTWKSSYCITYVELKNRQASVKVLSKEKKKRLTKLFFLLMLSADYNSTGYGVFSSGLHNEMNSSFKWKLCNLSAS